MKTTLVVGAFLAAALTALPLFALAKPGDPISGTSVGLEHDPCRQPCKFAFQTKTNGAGVATFRNVTPGKYRITITIFDRWDSGPCPCAADVAINIPGQTKVVRTISKADAHSRITAVALDPRDASGNRLLIPFTVAENKVQTVTVTITKVGAGRLQLPRP